MDKTTTHFIFAGAVLTVTFLVCVNVTTGADHFWSFYPSAFLLLGGVSVFWRRLGTKVVALLLSAVFLALCLLYNFVETPDYFWVPYALAPAVLWPLAAFLGERSLTRAFAICASSAIAGYYVALNVFYEPRFPWSIFIVFSLCWWPLSLFLAKKPRFFATVGALLITIFFIVLNGVTTPAIFWAIHPIFAAACWPLSLYLWRKPLAFAIGGAALSIVYLSCVNATATPATLWAVYPTFALLWWPLAVYFFVHRPRKWAKRRQVLDKIKKV